MLTITTVMMASNVHEGLRVELSFAMQTEPKAAQFRGIFIVIALSVLMRVIVGLMANLLNLALSNFSV